ncbi:MAG: hypothetical protein WD002_02470 [Pseudomonadales bacterium]
MQEEEDRYHAGTISRIATATNIVGVGLADAASYARSLLLLGSDVT